MSFRFSEVGGAGLLPAALPPASGRGQKGGISLAKLRVERPCRGRFAGIKPAIQLAGLRNRELGMGQPILVINKLDGTSQRVGAIGPCRAMLASEAMDKAGKTFLANGRKEFVAK